MSDDSTPSYCHECKRPLTEIDNRGQLLRRLHGLQHLVVAQRRQGAAIGGGPALASYDAAEIGI
jgi:hypothetical protein